MQMIQAKIYNPADQPKEWLMEHFVVRTKLFEKIFRDIEQSKMKYPEQHYIIQGQQGMGKTTFLLRLKYEIENTSNLSSWLVPVFFNEESYDLTTLSNLWEKLLKYLDDKWETGGKYYKQTDEYIGSTDYEKKCFNLLIEILHAEKKKLVVLFDNFSQLFLDNLPAKEQHRLREILMSCADIRIIGASAVEMEKLHDYAEPFYEFFKIVNLDGLNKEETFKLINKLQESSDTKFNIQKSKSKIETLAILSGGVIRTIMLIYETILANENGNALKDLETILDRITPLYKHRIEDLPIQQRKIIDVMAKKWDAVSTKDISENIRENGQPLATKLVSAQLQQLEKNNIIIKKQTTTKNHLYQLDERFFNIWYVMRYGDTNDKNKVIWLAKFLEMLYNDRNSIFEFMQSDFSNFKSRINLPESNNMSVKEPEEKYKTFSSNSINEPALTNNNDVLKSKQIFAYLLENNFELAFSLISSFVENSYSYHEIEIQKNILLLLIAKKQYHFTLQLFQNEKWNLKDRLKPIYYVLMHYLKDEYPNEYIKMGNELKQPVEDIMKQIEQMAIDYA